MLITYQACMFRRFFCFYSCFSNLLFFLWEKKACVHVPGSHGIFHFRFSFWVLISVYVFTSSVCIASAQLGNGLSLTVCISHSHPAFPVPVRISKTEIPDIWFSLSLSHLNESKFFYFTDFAFASVALRPVFSPYSLCVSGGVWFLHFFSAFIFLWMLIKRGHPSCMVLLYQPFPPFY